MKYLKFTLIIVCLVLLCKCGNKIEPYDENKNYWPNEEEVDYSEDTYELDTIYLKGFGGGIPAHLMSKNSYFMYMKYYVGGKEFERYVQELSEDYRINRQNYISPSQIEVDPNDTLFQINLLFKDE